MVVEFLTFAVAPDELDEWLDVERRVWSRFLETVPGFLRKEMWQPAGEPGTVHAVIWWESREAWKAVTPEAVAETDERMGQWFRPSSVAQYSVVRSG